MNRTTKMVVLSLSITVLVLTAFFGGFAVSQIVFIADHVRASQNAELTRDVSDLFNLMQNEALDPPSETTATVGALNGLLRSNGDNYARFLPEEELQRYEESMMGAFGGIGVLLGEQNDTVFILQVYEGTPAEAAGLLEGDYFYRVDDETRTDWTTQELSSRVRGEIGTDVELTMVRPFDEDVMPMSMDHPLGDPFDVTITRDTIQAPITEARLLEDGVGYVRLFEFNRRATDELREDVEDLIEQGATSLILDLRDNPGGDLNEAIGVSSLFIESGTIVQIESSTRPMPEVLSRRGQPLSVQLPMVCIVNGNSASAAEIVSGALQDHERAILVGVETFGKASVQTQIPFRRGAAFMTTAHYLTANGRVINDVGNTPDIIVETSIAERAEEETDQQLQRAIVEAQRLSR
ncbi:MAG: S41 family peptidase [Coriobacteriia bacterium]|nr:S41 family peptidase [Coriobacteriia bacterium]